MKDFDKLVKALGMEISEDEKKAILVGDCELVFFWNMDGSLRDWGIL